MNGPAPDRRRTFQLALAIILVLILAFVVISSLVLLLYGNPLSPPVLTPTNVALPVPATPTSTAALTPTPTSTSTPSPLPATSTATSTVLLPTAQPTVTGTSTPKPPPSGGVRVLCDGQVYDGYKGRLFQLQSAVDQDPNIQKIIRNCVFRNSTEAPIAIRNAKNVLIEGNTFENLRTNQPGVGLIAIDIACRAVSNCTSGNGIDDITIQHNIFRYIGADAIQLGEEARYISHINILDNEFVAREGVGENAIDVKGVEGPIMIAGNQIHGFRPCLSPKTNPPGNQDCTGSNGPGVIIHAGGAVQTAPNNVTIENNDIYDNTYGLVVSSGAENIMVRGNRIHNNLLMGILLNQAFSVTVSDNILSDNPTQIQADSAPAQGGVCIIRNNTSSGTGAPLVLKSSLCN